MFPIGFSPAQTGFLPQTNFNTAVLPATQFSPNPANVALTSASLMQAMQQLQSGFMGFAGAPAPFVGGFQFQPMGSPAPGFTFGGFPPMNNQPTPFPTIGYPSFSPLQLGGHFPPMPSYPLAGGGPSLASQALMLQVGVSDSLIAGNIGFASGGMAGLAGARGAALSPFGFF